LAESILSAANDVLTLERHGARTLANLRVRLSARLAALAAAVMLNLLHGRSAAPWPSTRHKPVAHVI
jgi:hypothetical protein